MFALPVEAIAQYCNPFEGCWLDVERPPSLEEVARILEAGEEALLDTTCVLWKEPEPGARERHAKKIAFFVRYGYDRPVEIDVGVPNLGCRVDYMVQDGNHRLAADIYRWKWLGETRLVPVDVCGDVGHARELGLWPQDCPEPVWDNSNPFDWAERRYGGLRAGKDDAALGYFVTRRGAHMYYARLRDELKTWLGAAHATSGAPLQQQLTMLGLQHYFEMGSTPTLVPYSLHF